MKPTESILQAVFTCDIEENRSMVEQVVGPNTDLARRAFIYHETQNISGVCYFIEGLCQAQGVEKILQALVVYSMQMIDQLDMQPQVAEDILQQLMLNASVSLKHRVGEAVDGLLAGETVLLLDGLEQAIVVDTKGYETRSVEEPATENVIRGPRDGFTENIRTNTALVRRRIRDPFFRIDALKIGRRTKTDVNIAYIQGVVKEGLVKEVTDRLNRIDIDGILESGYIEELIEDSPLSPFNTIQSTERPDKVASSLLEGRVAIFVDNTPFVLIVPTFFWQYLQASDDYYSRYWAGTLFRFIRYAAFIISLTFTSIYVMLVAFHHEMIPTGLALTIASGRDVVPFPVLLEALLMEIVFELMREAGLRMPKPIGQAVSIVGSLIIGQAAVQAGLVSPFMVIVVAITGISSFAIPNYAASFSIRLLRFPLLLASGFAGLLGFSAVFFSIIIHALSIRSFGEPYLAPASPFRPSDQKDAVIRMPWWSMQKRPSLASESVRAAGDAIPKAPPQGGQTGPQRKSGGGGDEA